MFTTPCFICKNTPELVDKLVELGYRDNGHRYDDRFYLCVMDDFLFQENKLAEIPDKVRGHYCGTNEELFLAIAALRDDSDKYQWFVDEFGLWEKCNHDKFHFICVTSFEPLEHEDFCWHFHKATVEELIEHFK